MSAVSRTRTVREIAADLPGAAEVFRRAGINFCCGGDVALEAAAVQAGLEADHLVAELQQLEISANRDAPEITDALIEYVVNRYHAAHRTELEWLVPLAQKVERVHGDHASAPRGLSESLAALQRDLESQMAYEESELFPAMLQEVSSDMSARLRSSRNANSDFTRYLEAVEHATNGLDLPQGACGSWTALYTGLRKFCDDLVAHTHVENSVLFARFESAGSAG